MRSCSNSNAELDALGLEDEEEGTSYLADLNKAPDFIDEAPVELTEVRISNLLPNLCSLRVLYIAISGNPGSHQDHLSTLPPFLPVLNFHAYTICV